MEYFRSESKLHLGILKEVFIKKKKNDNFFDSKLLTERIILKRK